MAQGQPLAPGTKDGGDSLGGDAVLLGEPAARHGTPLVTRHYGRVPPGRRPQLPRVSMMGSSRGGRGAALLLMGLLVRFLVEPLPLRVLPGVSWSSIDACRYRRPGRHGELAETRTPGARGARPELPRGGYNVRQPQPPWEHHLCRLARKPVPLLWWRLCPRRHGAVECFSDGPAVEVWWLDASRLADQEKPRLRPPLVEVNLFHPAHLSAAQPHRPAWAWCRRSPIPA